LESQEDVEGRLVQKFNLAKRELFQSDAEILIEAFRKIFREAAAAAGAKLISS